MTHNNDDDRTLLDAVLTGGDERAFRILFHRHSPVLRGFLCRILTDRAGECDDLVQETWIRALQALDRFRWQSGFRTWLLGVGYNLARHELRRSSSLELHAEHAVRAAPPVEERIDLERAIALLPHGFRTVLVLHDIYGFTHECIADMLGISPGTSKSQLSRARGVVRARIGDAYREITL